MAKAKCDRNINGCARCGKRRLLCVYPRAESLRGPVDASHELEDDRLPGISSSAVSTHVSSNNLLSDIGNGTSSTRLAEDLNLHLRPDINSLPGTFTAAAEQPTPERHLHDFSNLNLSCPINADDISNRWLHSYVPIPGQTVKQYPTSITTFLHRILKSYAAVMVHGSGLPPYIHSLQVKGQSTASPLSACLSVVRVCDKLTPGSEIVALDILQREMNKLYEAHHGYDDVAILDAFQAYLSYSMVLFFWLPQDSRTFLHQAVMRLQDIACTCSRRGLVCLEEQKRLRPRWEAWIVAEAKRRTLFTMYLFDNVLSAHDSAPSYVGNELRGLPAPSGKSHWQAEDRGEWEAAYNTYIAEWAAGILTIDELWAIPADMSEGEIAQRRDRVDRWLERVDEFGTMLYAVTSCTHGG